VIIRINLDAITHARQSSLEKASIMWKRRWRKGGMRNYRGDLIRETRTGCTGVLIGKRMENLHLSDLGEKGMKKKTRKKIDLKKPFSKSMRVDSRGGKVASYRGKRNSTSRMVPQL